MIGSKRKIVILFVSDSEDHILEKILKTVVFRKNRTRRSAYFTFWEEGLPERKRNSAEPT